jgi:hypothetical protein
MKIEDFVQWPFRSTDPAANIAIAVFLGLIILIALILGATIVIPVLVVIGIAKGVQWYVNRPVPTDQLYMVTQQRSVSANFPDTEKFMVAHLDRFVDVIRDDLPARSIYVMMARITETLYERTKISTILSRRFRRSSPSTRSKKAASATSSSPTSARQSMRRAPLKSSMRP